MKLSSCLAFILSTGVLITGTASGSTQATSEAALAFAKQPNNCAHFLGDPSLLNDQAPPQYSAALAAVLETASKNGFDIKEGLSQIAAACQSSVKGG